VGQFPIETMALSHVPTHIASAMPGAGAGGQPTGAIPSRDGGPALVGLFHGVFFFVLLLILFGLLVPDARRRIRRFARVYRPAPFCLALERPG
jgi:hypothetical protein